MTYECLLIFLNPYWILSFVMCCGIRWRS